MIKKLIHLANQLDIIGLHREANTVDAMMTKMAQWNYQTNLPPGTSDSDPNAPWNQPNATYPAYKEDTVEGDYIDWTDMSTGKVYDVSFSYVYDAGGEYEDYIPSALSIYNIMFFDQSGDPEKPDMIFQDEGQLLQQLNLAGAVKEIHKWVASIMQPE